ncbi:MAG: hypothetical protein J0I20_01500 [Chloroflexi bacterium]|nr:hypothetical protein [Chloroflexota bacterium]OJV89541.1 MAG: hypothetical protein BGO39_36885 [Chloroflexi bacterium 54-19]
MNKASPNLPEDFEDKLLADWVEGLSDPPPGLVNATLEKLRNATTVNPVSRRAPRWNRLVLGGMAAVVALVVVGLVLLTLLNGGNMQSPENSTAVSQVLTVTPGESPTPVPVQTATAAPNPTATPFPSDTSAPATFTPAAVLQNSPQSQVDAPTYAANPTPSATLPAKTTVQATSSPVMATDEPVLPTVAPAQPTFTLRPKPTQPAPTQTPVPPTPTPSGPATPIVGVYTIPASASPAANRTFSGQVKTLTATSLTLSNLTNVFILDSATKVRVNGQASTVSALKVGDNVVIQAAFNDQGDLIAQTISTSVTTLPKPITLPGSGN